MEAIDAKVMAGEKFDVVGDPAAVKKNPIFESENGEKIEVATGNASCVSFAAKKEKEGFIADVNGKEYLVVGDNGVANVNGGSCVDFDEKSDIENGFVVEEILRENKENSDVSAEDNGQVLSMEDDGQVVSAEDDSQVEVEEIDKSTTEESEKNLVAETPLESEVEIDERKIQRELDVVVELNPESLVVESKKDSISDAVESENEDGISDAVESENKEEPGNLDAEPEESEIVNEKVEVVTEEESEESEIVNEKVEVVTEEESEESEIVNEKVAVVTEEEVEVAADESETQGELESEKDGGLVEKQSGVAPSNGSDVSICTDADEADLVSAARKDGDEKASSVEAERNERIKEAPMDAEGLNKHVLEKRVCWLVKVPWLHDAEMNAQVQHAHSRFHELLKARKAIEADYAEQKVKVQNLQEMRDAARAEERPARNAVAAKRKEIDVAEGKLGMLKKATALNDIKDKIKKIEHTIGHETLSVKQEKASINEIKQLKIELKSFSSNAIQKGKEVEESLDEKQIVDGLKMLTMAMEPLRTELFRVEDRRLSAEKQLQEEREHRNHLQAQQKLAYNDCQNAYTLWQKLRSESNEERKHRREYLEDRDTARSLRSSGDIEKLSCHCDNQIKKIIDLWNTDEKFRKRYIESNTRSTWTRFKTLDGRSLGPNEQPHALPSNAGKNTTTAPRSSSNASQPASVSAPERREGANGARETSSSPSNQVPQRCQPVTWVKTNKGEEEGEEVRPRTTSMDESKEMLEKAEELAQKEDEARRAKMEAELKEQLRLEQKAKAKEAEERKRKQAEKARATAELKAKKEEELKAKKRAKRERKKRKAAAAAAAETSASAECGTTESSENETAAEAAVPAAIEPATSSQPPKPANKQKMVQPFQVILRNRRRRKWQTWLWMAAVIFLVVGLFYFGNHIAIPRSRR